MLCSSASLSHNLYRYRRGGLNEKKLSNNNHATIGDLTVEFAISSSVHATDARIK